MKTQLPCVFFGGSDSNTLINISGSSFGLQQLEKNMHMMRCFHRRMVNDEQITKIVFNMRVNQVQTLDNPIINKELKELLQRYMKIKL